MDAFDKDSAAIGLRSKTHVVLACVNEADEVVSLPRPKILKVDDHIGVAFADLPANFRYISKDLQFECNNYKLTFGSPLPVGRLVEKVQPSGDGLLAAGSDESGAHLYHSCPSGNDSEYQAFAIGSHSQAAKTYLERRFETFTNSSLEDLIKDALIAIRETLQGERLKSSICTVAVVGVGEPFHILDQETIQQLIDAFEIVAEEVPPAAEPAAAAEEGAAAEQGAPAEEGAAPDEGVVPMEL